MNTHKKLGGALALLALVSATACSGSSEPQGSEITLWMYPVIQDEGESQAFWEQIETEFDETHEDIDLTIELGTFDQRDVQISAAIAAGTGPDIVMITPDQVGTYRATNGLLPLNDALTETQDAFLPETLEVVDYDGELYGAPLFQNATTMAYNTALFDEAGISDLPETWDEVLEAAPVLADHGYAIFDYGGNPEVTLNVTFYPLLWQAGGRVFTEDGDIAFDSPEAEAAVRFLLDLKEMGGLPADAATQAHTVEGSPLAEGMVAMRQQTNLQELAQWRAAVGEGNVILGPPLTGVEQMSYATPAMLALTSINAEENREAAYEVIRYLTAPEQQAALNAASGTFPTRTDVDPPSDNPDDQAMSDALEYFTAGENHPQARQVMAILAQHLQSALQENVSPEVALSAAAEEARALISR